LLSLAEFLCKSARHLPFKLALSTARRKEKFSANRARGAVRRSSSPRPGELEAGCGSRNDLGQLQQAPDWHRSPSDSSRLTSERFRAPLPTLPEGLPAPQTPATWRPPPIPSWSRRSKGQQPQAVGARQQRQNKTSPTNIDLHVRDQSGFI
jgi:hypothetical protein